MAKKACSFLSSKTRLELQSAGFAIRYATFTGEACSVILTEKGRVIYSVQSDEAKALGFSFVRSIPAKAAVPEARNEPKVIKTRHGASSAWFGERSNDPWAYEEIDDRD